MVTGIIIAAVLVGGVGLFIGLFLGIAGKKFAVEVDEKEILVREALPGNNCGGCGYPGCDGLAAAIAKREAPVNACPVGGAAAAVKIGEIMGQEAGDGPPVGSGHHRPHRHRIDLRCLWRGRPADRWLEHRLRPGGLHGQRGRRLG